MNTTVADDQHDDQRWSIALSFIWRSFAFAAVGLVVGIGLAFLGLPEPFAKLAPMAGLMLAMKVWFDRTGQPPQKFWVMYVCLLSWLITMRYFFEYVL